MSSNDSDGTGSEIASAVEHAAKAGGAKTQYIRKEWWCECERSCNTAKGELENGLSVHECLKEVDAWRPTGPAWTKRRKQLPHGEPDGGVWLLIEATPVGATGGDGEPLVTDVELVRRLDWDTGSGVFVDAGVVERQFDPHPCHEIKACKCRNTAEEYLFRLAEHEALMRDDDDQDDEAEDDNAPTD